MTTTELHLKRLPLPPIEIPDGSTEWDRHDTYAEVSCAGITAEVVRFAYWHNDGDGLELTFEVLINGGLPDSAGCSEVYANYPEELWALAAVCGQAGLLLAELQLLSRAEVPA